MDAIREMLPPLQFAAAMAWEWLCIAAVWCGDILSNPFARALGLSVIVYATIRVIASVYAGDRQNSEMGPVGLRPHVAGRLTRDTIVVPRDLLPLSMDGVVARLRVFYVYNEADGKTRRKAPVFVGSRQMRLSVAAARLPAVQSTKYGYEIPDVLTEDVCFPAMDPILPVDHIAATPDHARGYAELHRLVERWTEDDNALLISLHPDVLEEIVENREQYIKDKATEVRRARAGNPIQRWLARSVAEHRPNVIGSYTIKLEFSHEPFFVLTRHPDRDLKMTAWLTVLTSFFALVMEAWPTSPAAHVEAAPQAREQTVRVPRLPN